MDVSAAWRRLENSGGAEVYIRSDWTVRPCEMLEAMHNPYAQGRLNHALFWTWSSLNAP